MRLHSLVVTAFGPFAGTESVDFDKLAAAGLFLFTDLASLLVAEDILAMPLTTGTGKTVRLTD